MDLSAPLRQGRILGYEYPNEFANATKTMMRVMGTESGTEAVELTIKNHPLFGLADGRVFFSERAAKGGLAGTTFREERFISNWASKIPGIGKGVDISERAYTVWLNKFRHDVFYKTVGEWQAAGKKVTSQELDDLADMINWGTGRGALPKWTEGKVADILSAFFFAPRFATSAPSFVIGGAVRAVTHRNARVSKMWANSLASFIGSGMLWLEKLHLMGAEVELDPRSSDFGKGKFGKHRFDFWGGYQPIVRYATQIALKQRKSISTGEIYGVDRDDVFWRLIRSKLSPFGSLTRDAMSGEDFMGREFSGASIMKDPVGFVQERLVPMVISDFTDAWNAYNDPMDMFRAGVTMPGTLFAIYGGGFQTFETMLDIKDEVTNQIFPGKIYDDLIPGSKEQHRVNSPPVVREWIKERRSERPKADPEDAWVSGIRVYGESVRELEEGRNSESEGAIYKVLSQTEGKQQRDEIRAYLNGKWQAWQTAITPDADAWHQQKERRWTDPADGIKLYRDIYLSVTAQDIVLSDRSTGLIDFQGKKLEQEAILKDAVQKGVIPSLNGDGVTPDPSSDEFDQITSRRPMLYEQDWEIDPTTGQLPKEVLFSKAVYEYQEDMDTLSELFFGLDRQILEKIGIYDRYAIYVNSDVRRELRDIDPKLDQALEVVSQLKTVIKSLGWDPQYDYLNPSPNDKEKALKITRILLRWGFVSLPELPNELQKELGEEHYNRNEQTIREFMNISNPNRSLGIGQNEPS